MHLGTSCCALSVPTAASQGALGKLLARSIELAVQCWQGTLLEGAIAHRRTCRSAAIRELHIPFGIALVHQAFKELHGLR